MTVLIIGYPDSGKSKLAEDLVLSMSDPGERVYLATMIPYGAEGAARVEKHRRMRECKEFFTSEVPFDVAEALSAPSEDRTVLLECLSNLVANEMFERHTDTVQVIEKITHDIDRLSEKVRNLVVVSNHFETTDEFDEETVLYAKTIDEINDRLSLNFDKTIRL